MQCTNHVKQISLALHNFADVYKEVLPSDGYVGNIDQGPYTKTHGGDSTELRPGDGATDVQNTAKVETNASVLVSILPYVEQQAIYEKFSFAGTSGFVNIASGTGNWGASYTITALDAATVNKAKINYFICPSGEHEETKSAPFVASYVGIAGGTNYGADDLVAAQTLSYGKTAATADTLFVNTTGKSGGAATKTPFPASFQTASLTNGVFPAGGAGSLKMADGTSNTIVFGEISWDVGAADGTVLWYTVTTARQLGAWYKGARIAHNVKTETVTNYQSYYTKVVTPFDLVKVTASDTALSTTPGNTAGTNVSLSPHKVLNGGKNKTTNVGTGTVKQYLSFERASNAGSWGSNHTSVVIFGLGDGSVRGISDGIQPNVICNLAVTKDGVAVTLP